MSTKTRRRPSTPVIGLSGEGDGMEMIVLTPGGWIVEKLQAGSVDAMDDEKPGCG
jgi:hypothetical protein